MSEKPTAEMTDDVANRIITEWMGLCWHEWPPFACIGSIRRFPKGSIRYYCAKCNERVITMSHSYPPAGPDYCTDWGVLTEACERWTTTGHKSMLGFADDPPRRVAHALARAIVAANESPHQNPAISKDVVSG